MPPKRADTFAVPGNTNPIESRLNAYDNGDVNRPELLSKWRSEWTQPPAAPTPGPYLKYIKDRLVRRWPHLQLLVDFMDVGTTPVRWNDQYKQGGYSSEPFKRGKTAPASHS